MNGYHNHAQWNQSLWLNNDEGLYALMKDAIRATTTRKAAASWLLYHLNDCGITHTPDGVKWSRTGIQAGMVGI